MFRFADLSLARSPAVVENKSLYEFVFCENHGENVLLRELYFVVAEDGGVSANINMTQVREGRPQGENSGKGVNRSPPGLRESATAKTFSLNFYSHKNFSKPQIFGAPLLPF